MKYIYDRESDSLSIIFADGRRYRDSEEIVDGVVVDYDTAGKPIAIEFHDRASRFVDTDGLAAGREVYVEHPDIIEAGGAIDGIWLRLQRSKLGFTQEQLADALTVAKNTIARWERNEVRIEHAGMLKLALDQLGQRTSAHSVPASVDHDNKDRSPSARTRTVFRSAATSEFVTSAQHQKTAVRERVRDGDIRSARSGGHHSKEASKKR